LTASGAASDSDAAYSRAGYRAYALALLTCVYIFSYIDRKIIFIVQEPIKLEFGLSDAELGLLTGFMFMLFYVVFGIPFARWADKGVRRTVIAIAIGFWSLMTALCGLAQTYTHLLLARTGVAVGEAGGSPPSHSMISDIFPAQQRGTAMSIYTTGVYLGVLVGFALGGWISQHFGWRTAFIVVGAPGILMAVLVRLTLKEPRRGMADKLQRVEEAPPLLDVLKMLWSRRSFRYMVAAATMSAFFTNNLIGWMPSFLMRSHEMNISEVGLWLALILGVVGGIGALSGGFMGDRLGDKDRRWNVFVPAIALAVALPFTLLTFVVQDQRLSLLAYCIPVLVSGMYAGPVIAMTHAMVSLRARAMASAVFFFIQNMIGLGLGPVAVGWLSDSLAPSYSQHSLRYALLIALTVSTVLAITCYLLASRHLRDDLEKARG
jgi:predicted MFS family arabinose efflux permease